MSSKIELDLTPFLSYGLSTNPLISKDLDLLYEKYKFRAYNSAKNSKYYSYPLLTDGSIKREVSSKRALGLIELNKNKNDSELDKSILNLFDKGWNKLSLYVKNTDIIDIEYVMSDIIENKDDDDYYLGFNAALLLFATIYGKEILPIDFRDTITKYFYDYSLHLDIGDKRFSYDFVKKDKDLMMKAKSIKDRFLENFSFLNNTCDLVDLAIDDEEIADFCRAVNVIFDSENMMLSSMTDNANILEKDIIQLAALYFIHNKNQNRIESAKFILFGLHLKYAIKAYKDLKDFYFKNNKETLYIELESHEVHSKLLKEDNLSLNRRLEALEYENNKLRKEYKESIEKENILLKRELEKLKSSITKLEIEKKELNRLVESFFNIDDDIDKIVVDNEPLQIPNIKAVIAGGNSNWHDKIKDYLPDSFVYIVGSNERFDESILNNKDYVFIYTKYMGHGFYYKLIEKCRKMNININYISATFPHYVQKEIYEIVNSKKPTF